MKTVAATAATAPVASAARRIRVERVTMLLRYWCGGMELFDAHMRIAITPQTVKSAYRTVVFGERAGSGLRLVCVGRSASWAPGRRLLRGP
ncbi:hypothetical protein Stube_00600 [Streptomyces tubercidicus]|uniref:Uncharacterized protein n=1 Tax=Streptomyces tubercidicus TaxID=47759 RepID=A0A640UHY7_9ACTN|nr:hypothetical protein Stube_00600 [Streptomyces tubercidicus]